MLQTLHALDDSVLSTKGTSNINSLYSGAANIDTVFTNSLASSSYSALFDNTGISVVESSVLAGESHSLSQSWKTSESEVYLTPHFVHDEILPIPDSGYTKTFPAFLESSYVDQTHDTYSTIIPAVTDVADTTTDGVSSAGNTISQGSLLKTSNKITGNPNLCHLSQCSQSFSGISSNLQQSGRLTQYNIDNGSQDYGSHLKSTLKTELIEKNTAIPFGNGNRTFLYMTGYLESFYTAEGISTSATHDNTETRRVSPNESFEILVNDRITSSQIDNPSSSEFESITATETSPEDDNNSKETTDIILPSYTPSTSYLTYDVRIQSSYQAALSTADFHPSPFCITSCNSEVFHTQGRDYRQSAFHQDAKLTISAELTGVSNTGNSDMKTAIVSATSAFQDVSSTTIDSVSQTEHTESVSGYSDATPILTGVTMTKVSESPTRVEPSSTKAYRFVLPTQSTDNVWSNRHAMDDVELLETSGYKHVSSPILDVSSLSVIQTSADYHINEKSSSLYSAQTVDITPTVAEDRPSTRLTAIYIPEDVTTVQWINTTEAASPKQMHTFNTTIIIASASAVLALVIVVIIALVCLKRKKDRSPASKLQSDDLWVDLYRSNPAHHMPLPSLTSCLSAFEMSEAVNQGHIQDVKVESKQHVADETILIHAGQEKTQKVSSFQIKKSNLEPDREFISLQPAIELEAPMELDHTEYWTNLFKSVSMTSLPTTELSYNTNVTDYNFAAAGHKFRVVYAYKPVCKGEMGLKEGELIICNERDRNGWMFGSKPKTNEEGWFPAVYVDEISNDDELYFSSDVPETYDLLESNKLHSLDQYWTGIEHKVYDKYGSSVPGDLNLEPGETVIVLLTLANGWWFAVCGDNCGWFPGSYVQMTEEDNSVLEQPSDSDNSTNKPDQQSCNIESSPEAKTNKQEKQDKTNPEKADILQDHQLENDQKSPAEANKTIPESNNGSLTQGSHSPQEVSNGDKLMEPRYSPDTQAITYRSETGLEGQVQLSESYHTPSSSTNPIDNLSKSKVSVHKDLRKGKSLRPARPAPPPPKQKPHKTPKDNILNTGTNKASDSQPATPVLKKPVILVRGKRPKLHKVLRSRLDDKKLNPMIRPSTRGYISKPTMNAENGWKNSHYDYRRKAFNSHELNSSPSITDDFHGDFVTLLGQSNASPSHVLGFRPIAKSDQWSSSKASLESGSDDKSISPCFVVNNDKGMKGKSKQSKHSESPVNNISARRNLSPETKKEKSISPKLFTTSNLLQNVQRFHGALRQASPSPSSDWEKDLSAENGRSEQTGSNEHTLNSAIRHQRAPTTVTPPKIPTFISSSDYYSLSGNKQNGYGNVLSLEINSDLDSTQAESENLTPMISLSSNPNNSDDYSDRKNIERRPSRMLKPEISTPNRDSLRVTPGTVSEIVHHINSLSPQQQMKDLSEDNETTGKLENKGEIVAQNLITGEQKQHDTETKDLSISEEPITVL